MRVTVMSHRARDRFYSSIPSWARAYWLAVSSRSWHHLFRTSEDTSSSLLWESISDCSPGRRASSLATASSHSFRAFSHPV
jgi:hypothetical protein